MTKREFLLQLNDALATMNGDERSAAIQYYSDYIDDAGPENLDEVLAQLGDPRQVAASILAEAGAEPRQAASAQAAAPTPAPGKTGLPGWAVVLIVLLLSPAWLPVVCSAFGIAIGCLATLVGMIVAAVCLVLGGGAGILVGITMLLAEPLAGLLAAGVGCIICGLGLLLGLLCVFICRTVIPTLTRWLRMGWQRIFHKGGAAA